MTAYRVVDDHKELDNVGSNTHDQIDTHINATPFIIVSGAGGNVPPSARLLTGSGLTIADGGPGGNLLLTVTGGGSSTPAGNDTEIQFNDGGVFGSDTNFTFDKNTNTLTVNNLSGSLTKLSDGTSYLVAGNNVAIVTGSNGSITISSTATGGGGGDGDSNATYLVLSATGSLNNERVFTTGNGLQFIDGGSGGNYTLSVDDSVVATLSGSTFVGSVNFNAGLSGSLTKLIDGTSYLRAGNNVTIATGSNGSITISSIVTGSGAPGGLDTQVQFNDGGNFAGDSNFIFDKVTNTLSVTNLSSSLTRLQDGSSYLIAGSNVTIVTGSNGSITISSTGGGGATTSALTSWMETPVGDVDGINMVYTLNYSPFPTNSLMFYVNGVLQTQGMTYDYSLSTNTIIMNYAPSTGSNLTATYAYVVTPPAGVLTSWMEFPLGLIDGINNIFTLAHSPQPSSALMFYNNGILQRQGSTADYLISGSTITMNYIPNSGSNIVATYPY